MNSHVPRTTGTNTTTGQVLRPDPATDEWCFYDQLHHDSDLHSDLHTRLYFTRIQHSKDPRQPNAHLESKGPSTAIHTPLTRTSHCTLASRCETRLQYQRTLPPCPRPTSYTTIQPYLPRFLPPYPLHSHSHTIDTKNTYAQFP